MGSIASLIDIALFVAFLYGIFRLGRFILRTINGLVTRKPVVPVYEPPVNE